MKEVFIIGNPRSGTSFLRTLLTNHPNVIIPPESHFFLWLEEKFSNWSPKDGLDDFLEELYNSTKFETWKLNRIALTKWLTNQRVNSYSNLIANVYLFYGLSNGKTDITVWGDKNKLWKEKLPAILKYYPEAFFIHIIRDGRDVACSFRELASKSYNSKYAPKLPYDIKTVANRWAKNIDAISAFKSSVSEQNFFELKYESLIREPEGTLKDVCEFLKIRYEKQMLYYEEEKMNSLFEPVEFMEWKPKLLNKPDKNNIGKFKTQLTKKEIREFEQIAGLQLSDYNYACHEE